MFWETYSQTTKDASGLEEDSCLMLVQTRYRWEKIPSHLPSIQGGTSAIANNDVKAENRDRTMHNLKKGSGHKCIRCKKLRKFLGPWPNYVVQKCSSSESVFVYF